MGTAFNVNTNGKSVDVLLVEGKVKVEEADSTDNYRILHPSQRVSYHRQNGLSAVSDAEDLNDILWTQGIILFDNTPMPEVIRTLEDWYAVNITTSGDFENLRYSGKFQDEYLSNILQSMSFSLDLEYSIEYKNVKLKLN